MASSSNRKIIRKIEHQAAQSMFELLYKGEHICYGLHLTGKQLLGFVYSGKWPDWGTFAEFFKSRNLSIPKSGNPYLTTRELSENERRIVTTYIPEANKYTASEQSAVMPSIPPAEQLDLLNLHPLQRTGYDERR
jgi:hypothetical protein